MRVDGLVGVGGVRIRVSERREDGQCWGDLDGGWWNVEGVAGSERSGSGT